MQNLKLSLLKRFLIMLLVMITNAVYHTNLHAYTCSNSASVTGNNFVCLAVSSFQLCSPNALCTTTYLCVTQSEYAMLNMNAMVQCSTYFSNTNGRACYDTKFSLTNYTCNCNAGYRGTGSSCVACNYGTYCFGHKPSVSKAASTCPPGTYQSQTTQSTCNPCPAGTYQNGDYPSKCTECNMGYYQPNSMQSACIAASSGHYVPSGGVNTKQTPCSVGFYQPNTAKSTCIQCPQLPVNGNSLFTFQGTTSTTGTVLVLQCYIPSGYLSQRDNIGTWVNRSGCPYTT